METPTAFQEVSMQISSCSTPQRRHVGVPSLLFRLPVLFFMRAIGVINARVDGWWCFGFGAQSSLVKYIYLAQQGDVASERKANEALR